MNVGVGAMWSGVVRPPLPIGVTWERGLASTSGGGRPLWLMDSVPPSDSWGEKLGSCLIVGNTPPRPSGTPDNSPAIHNNNEWGAISSHCYHERNVHWLTPCDLWAVSWDAHSLVGVSGPSTCSYHSHSNRSSVEMLCYWTSTGEHTPTPTLHARGWWESQW